MQSAESSGFANKEQARAALYQLLGRLPDRHRPLAATLVATEQTDELVIDTLLLDLNGDELVPAYFSRPRHPTGLLPVVLYNHAHFGQYAMGKKEFVQGRPEMQTPPYALALAQAGYAGLCIDSWCFGERQGLGEEDTFKKMLWHGRVLWGMMVYDGLRAVDYLHTRPEVDCQRIATLGMSMGSTMAWWLAALDHRIRVCVDICCLTDFQALLAADGLGLHSLYYYVPDLLTHFTTASINGLISPRPHLSVAGRFDPLTPLKGLKTIDRQLQALYKQEKNPAAWQLRVYESGHEETADMRTTILAFLATWL